MMNTRRDQIVSSHAGRNCARLVASHKLEKSCLELPSHLIVAELGDFYESTRPIGEVCPAGLVPQCVQRRWEEVRAFNRDLRVMVEDSGLKDLEIPPGKLTKIRQNRSCC